MEQSPSLLIRNHFIRNRVILSWVIGFVALALAGAFPDLLKQLGASTELPLSLARGFAMSLIVLTGLFVIQKVTGNKRVSIGIKIPSVALLQFIAGFGIILLPLLLSITFTELFNWGEVHFNLGNGLFISVALGFLATFLFEAFPEEVLFRGYIYSHLNVKYSKWLSGLITIGLFVLLPILLTLFHKHLLGMDIYLGGNYGIISPGYLISLIFFGCIVQYLRILSGGIWLGMGFHLAFVHLNKFIGPSDDKLIQLKGMSSDLPIQLVFVGSILVIVLILLLYPKMTKRSLNWNSRNL